MKEITLILILVTTIQTSEIEVTRINNSPEKLNLIWVCITSYPTKAQVLHKIDRKQKKEYTIRPDILTAQNFE